MSWIDELFAPSSTMRPGSAGLLRECIDAICDAARAVEKHYASVSPVDLSIKTARQDIEMYIGHTMASIAHHKAEQAAGIYWPGGTDRRAAIIKEQEVFVAALRDELTKLEG